MVAPTAIFLKPVFILARNPVTHAFVHTRTYFLVWFHCLSTLSQVCTLRRVSVGSDQ